MLCHRWFHWINNPDSGAVSVPSGKQEQEIPSDGLGSRRSLSCHHSCLLGSLSALCLLLTLTCVALSVSYHNQSISRSEWRRLLLDYQNISESYVTAAKANADLRGDNDMLKQHSVWLEQQTQLLNRTSAKLMSVNLALSSESTNLTERILNLTSTNSQLVQEKERLVQHTSEQEEERLNMSQTIRHLLDSNTQREEERRRLAEMSRLLKDELSQLQEENQELLGINNGLQGEIRNLSEQVRALLDCEETLTHNTQLQQKVSELQERNQNLSSVLLKERQEAAGKAEQTVANMRSVKEAYSSLDLYCPVVNFKTKERVCKKCPESWQLFDNKCYYFSSRMLTWSSSRAWCQAQGGDLLIVDSEPEQNFVCETSQVLVPGGARMWIGLTDGEEEGEWLWVDGSSVTSDVRYWLSRPGLGAEPDDWNLDDPLGEDCGHVDTSEKPLTSWMDGSCKIPYRWICEKNV